MHCGPEPAPIPFTFLVITVAQSRAVPLFFRGPCSHLAWPFHLLLSCLGLPSMPLADSRHFASAERSIMSEVFNIKSSNVSEVCDLQSLCWGICLSAGKGGGADATSPPLPVKCGPVLGPAPVYAVE